MHHDEPAESGPVEKPPPAFYACRSGGPLWQAGVVLAGAAALALLLPEAGLRLLALLFAVPPLVWGSYELLCRRAGLALEAEALVLRKPAALRPLCIPYAHVAGLTPWTRAPRLGLAYYVPRPPLEGEDDPRPPRLRFVATVPLADLPAALADLRRRVEQARPADPRMPPLPEAALRRGLRARRFRRASLLVALFLSTPLLVVVAVRVAFALRNALYFFLLK